MCKKAKINETYLFLIHILQLFSLIFVSKFVTYEKLCNMDNNNCYNNDNSNSNNNNYDNNKKNDQTNKKVNQFCTLRMVSLIVI